jgi:hypothetical protein
MTRGARQLGGRVGALLVASALVLSAVTATADAASVTKKHKPKKPVPVRILTQTSHFDPPAERCPVTWNLTFEWLLEKPPTHDLLGKTVVINATGPGLGARLTTTLTNQTISLGPLPVPAPGMWVAKVASIGKHKVIEPVPNTASVGACPA